MSQSFLRKYPETELYFANIKPKPKQTTKTPLKETFLENTTKNDHDQSKYHAKLEESGNKLNYKTKIK